MSELDDLRTKARAIGLERLSDEQLLQFGRAIAGIARQIERLPRDLAPSAEPAHIFRAKGGTP